MRTLCSFTLLMEAFVICFAALVAMRMTDVGAGTVWSVAAPGTVAAVALCGFLGKRWSVPVGWLLQLGLIASGTVVPMMYGLGAIFAVIWFFSVRVGRKVDAVKAARSQAVSGTPENAA